MTLHESVEKEFKSFLQMIDNLIFAGELDRDKVNTSLMFLYSEHIGRITKLVTLPPRFEKNSNLKQDLMEKEVEDAKHKG